MCKIVVDTGPVDFILGLLVFMMCVGDIIMGRGNSWNSMQDWVAISCGNLYQLIRKLIDQLKEGFFPLLVILLRDLLFALSFDNLFHEGQEAGCLTLQGFNFSSLVFYMCTLGFLISFFFSSLTLRKKAYLASTF